jgi:hypothetical protein
MKKWPKKLKLAKETLRNLETEALGNVQGGAFTQDRSVCVTGCATNCNVSACLTNCLACA